jgi:hypothetical protein
VSDREYFALYRERNRAKLNAYHREWCEQNRERTRQYKGPTTEEKQAYRKAYYIKNRERLLRQSKDYMAKHKGKTTYKITKERFLELLAEQGGKCAICGLPAKQFKDGRSGWATDHCHGGGHFRGILCLQCNVGLGNFKDDIYRLRAALEYLVRDQQCYS